MKENKDKYRKRPYTPKFKRPFSSEAGNFLRKLLKISPGKKEKFLQDSYAKNPDLELIYLAIYLKHETTSFLMDMGDKGADIKLLFDMIYCSKEFAKHNKSIDEGNKRVREYIKREKAIRGAVKLLCSLKPIPDCLLDISSQDLNKKMEIMQKQICILPTLPNKSSKSRSSIITKSESLIETYLKFMPLINITDSETEKKVSLFLKERKLSAQCLRKMKFKPIKQSTSFWNEPIMLLVDEFKRIGFSNKQAYIKTAEFLNIVFPDIYKDKDPDLVRQRYSYHSKKNPP